MKLQYLIIASFLLLTFSCGTITQQTTKNVKLETQWVLQNENVDQLGLGKEPITISFGLEEDSKFSGFGGCNYYGGNFTRNENQITIGEIYATKRACPDLEIETEFFKLLEGVDNYEISGNNLYLYKGKLLFLHFKK